MIRRDSHICRALLAFAILQAPLAMAQRLVHQARIVEPPNELPLHIAFVGEERFNRVMATARRKNFASLPIGERVAAFGLELVGTPYKGFTLEIHDHIESPSANFHGLDCWTFFEVALGLARMMDTPRAEYTPVDLLREIETTRYRGGRCTGNYLERIHYLAEWYVDNHARGTIVDLTAKLGGRPFEDRRCTEMTTLWKSYRYLRENPELRPLMKGHEERISRLPIRYIPRDRVRGIEKQIQSGDVIGIATKYQGGFCSHVGLAYRRNGVVHLMHASSDKKKVIVDGPIHDYLFRYNKNAGILVGRPLAVSHLAPARASVRGASRR